MAKFSLIISLSFSLISLQCFANESNLENFSYPSHDCDNKAKNPNKPAHFSSFEDTNEYNTAIVEYNIEVAAYNKEIKVYKSCINQYIKNGNHDINIIKNTLNNALKEARAK